MRSSLYCLYDDVSKEFAPPFMSKNNDVAIRQARQRVACYDASVISDFKLFRVGEFDTEEGRLHLLQANEHIVCDLVIKKVGNAQDQLRMFQQTQEVKNG